MYSDKLLYFFMHVHVYGLLWIIHIHGYTNQPVRVKIILCSIFYIICKAVYVYNSKKKKNHAKAISLISTSTSNCQV